MNRQQKLALIVAAANFAVIFLFPPFDSYSFTDSTVPIFAGFQFFFSKGAHEAVNTGVLFLEAAVVLINTGIAWLLLRDKKVEVTRRKFNYQNATLLTVAVNLVVILLFPPFEYYYAVTRAALPTFQGFFFIFFAGPKHTIVTTVLYLEVVFVLINGALFWFLFKERTLPTISPEEALRIAHGLQKRR